MAIDFRAGGLIGKLMQQLRQRQMGGQQPGDNRQIITSQDRGGVIPGISDFNLGNPGFNFRLGAQPFRGGGVAGALGYGGASSNIFASLLQQQQQVSQANRAQNLQRWEEINRRRNATLAARRQPQQKQVANPLGNVRQSFFQRRQQEGGGNR